MQSGNNISYSGLFNTLTGDFDNINTDDITCSTLEVSTTATIADLTVTHNLNVNNEIIINNDLTINGTTDLNGSIETILPVSSIVQTNNIGNLTASNTLNNVSLSGTSIIPSASIIQLQQTGQNNINLSNGTDVLNAGMLQISNPSLSPFNNWNIIPGYRGSTQYDGWITLDLPGIGNVYIWDNLEVANSLTCDSDLIVQGSLIVNGCSANQVLITDSSNNIISSLTLPSSLVIPSPSISNPSITGTTATINSSLLNSSSYCSFTNTVNLVQNLNGGYATQLYLTNSSITKGSGSILTMQAGNGTNTVSCLLVFNGSDLIINPLGSILPQFTNRYGLGDPSYSWASFYSQNISDSGSSLTLNTTSPSQIVMTNSSNQITSSNNLPPDLTLSGTSIVPTGSVIQFQQTGHDNINISNGNDLDYAGMLQISNPSLPSVNNWNIIPGYKANVQMDGWLTLDMPGTGNVYVWDNFEVEGNLTLDGSVCMGNTASSPWMACPSVYNYYYAFKDTNSYSAGQQVGSYIPFAYGQSPSTLCKLDLYVYDGTNFYSQNYSVYNFSVIANASNGIGVFANTTIQFVETRIFYIWIQCF